MGEEERGDLCTSSSSSSKDTETWAGLCGLQVETHQGVGAHVEGDHLGDDNVAGDVALLGGGSECGNPLHSKPSPRGAAPGE